MEEKKGNTFSKAVMIFSILVLFMSGIPLLKMSFDHVKFLQGRKDAAIVGAVTVVTQQLGDSLASGRFQQARAIAIELCEQLKIFYCALVDADKQILFEAMHSDAFRRNKRVIGKNIELVYAGRKLGELRFEYFKPDFSEIFVPQLTFVVPFLVFLLVVSFVFIWRMVRMPILNLTSYIDLIDAKNVGEMINKLQRFTTRIHEIKKLNEKVLEKLLQLKKYEEEKKRTESLVILGKAARMLAHDIRTPFAVSKTFLDLVGSAKSYKEVQAIVHTMGPNLKRAQSNVETMMTDVLVFGGDKAKKTRMPSLLTHQIYDSIRMLSEEFKQANVTIEYKFGHLNCPLFSKGDLTRVLINIIKNAIQAMDCTGKLAIETNERNGRIQIDIWNGDSFICAEDLKRLFDADFTKGKSSGTGLGLAIVKKLIELNEGSIKCKSSEETGTTFSIDIAASKKEDFVNIIMPEKVGFLETFSKKERNLCQWTDRTIVFFDENIEYQKLCQSFESEVKTIVKGRCTIKFIYLRGC